MLVGLSDFSFRARIRRWNQPLVKRSPINPELRKEMLAVFADDIRLLSELTGVNLDHWLQETGGE